VGVATAARGGLVYQEEGQTVIRDQTQPAGAKYGPFPLKIRERDDFLGTGDFQACEEKTCYPVRQGSERHGNRSAGRGRLRRRFGVGTSDPGSDRQAMLGIRNLDFGLSAPAQRPYLCEEITPTCDSEHRSPLCLSLFGYQREDNVPNKGCLHIP